MQPRPTLRKRRPNRLAPVEASNAPDSTISEGGAEILGKGISSGPSFSAAQIGPTIGQVWAEFFTSYGALGGAVDVDAALGRDRTNAVDPLMHHGRRRAYYARQLGLASEYFSCFLNMGIRHSENIVKQRSPHVKPCLL